MNDWNAEFGEARGAYLSAKLFDSPKGVDLTYRGFSKVEPEDLDFIISGTQNKQIKDSKKQFVLNKAGEKIENAYYDAKFPKGFQLRIEFDEGILSCTSFPLVRELHRVKPEPGDLLNIRRDASVITETKYFVKKIGLGFDEV